MGYLQPGEVTTKFGTTYLETTPQFAHHGGQSTTTQSIPLSELRKYGKDSKVSSTRVDVTTVKSDLDV